MTIVGEPGVGKSRLVRELWDALATEDRPPIARTGRCLAYGDGITYWPLGEIVREHFDLREGATHDDVDRRLAGREILGLALGLDVAPDLHPLDARERLHLAAVELVEELASGCPTVLVIEDIHWAEPDLLDLLERLVSDVRAPARAPRHRPAGGIRACVRAGDRDKRNATVLWLDPLSAPVAARTARRDAPGGPAGRPATSSSSSGRRAIRSSSKSSSASSSTAVRSSEYEDGWELRPIAMPASRCRTPCTRCSRRGSTASRHWRRRRCRPARSSGASSGRHPVVHLLDGDEPDFGLLEERDLIVDRRTICGRDDREFAIKHALTREVAYGSIPKARRGRLHASLRRMARARVRNRDGRAGAAPRIPLLGGRESEDADLVWADDAGRARACARAGRALALPRRPARARSPRDGRGGRAAHCARSSSTDDARAGAALARNRRGTCAAVRRRGDASRAPPRGRRSALRRGEGRHVCASRVPVVDPLGDVVDPSEHGASSRSGRRRRSSSRRRNRGEGTRAARQGQRRAAVARRTTSSREASALAETLDSRRAPFVRARRTHAGRRSIVAASTRQRRGASERLELLAGHRRSRPSVRGVRGGARPRLLPYAASTSHGDWPSCHAELSQRLSAHHRVHSVSLDLELADALGDWHGLAAQTDRALDGDRGQNLTTPCVRNPRDLLLCSVAHLCLGRRLASVGARARRLTARRRGPRDVPERPEDPDRAAAR